MSRAALPRLFANAGDVCTQKVLVAAKSAGVDLILESPKSGQTVPELRKGDKVIRYTNAILRFVGRCYEDSAVYGNNFIESAQVDSWLDWAEGELGHKEPPRLQQAIDVLERHLDDRVFLVGQRFSLADASVSCSLLSFQQQGLAPVNDLPRATKRWLGTCVHSEAFVSVMGSTGKSVEGKGIVHGSTPASTPASSLAASYSSCVGGRTQIGKIIRTVDGGKSLAGQVFSVCGWVKTKRDGAKGAMAFIELNDGSSPGSLQVVVYEGAKGFESLKECSTGASLKCVGKLIESPAQGQAVELQVLKASEAADHEVFLFGGVDAKNYPMSKKFHGLDFLRTIAHLRPRSNIIASVARIRSALAFATHEFFRSKGFNYVHTPLITAADCEGAGEMFQVTTMLSDAEKNGLPKQKDGKIDYTRDFFGKPAFLTVSGQLSAENYCCALSNVYTFGPTFRAENSHTSRHLAEFWMIEPEMAFADLNDDMQCAEDYLKYCVRFVYENHRDDLEFFDKQVEKGLIKRLENILAEPFARRSYTEACEILIKESKSGRAQFQVPVEWGIDLGSEHERYLTEKVEKKPTIVYNYPKDIKAFYMRLNDDNKTCAAMDCLVPHIGEVIGGSQREERLEVLDRRIQEMGLHVDDYWWYRDLRKYGSVPHAGFGLGFERLIMLCTGVENIRDVIPFPRYPGHAEF